MYDIEEVLVKDIIVKKIKVETEKIKVTLLSYGGTLMDLQTKNCQNDFETIVLGYDKVSDYFHDGACFGKNVGRVAGRIACHNFSLNGVVYDTESNSNGNTLHGGANGIAKRNFETMFIEDSSYINVIFSTIQKSSYDSFPGDLTLKITYKISKSNSELQIIYDGTTTEDTLVNITNHSYFNLIGNYDSDVLPEKLQINSSSYFDMDQNMIPKKISKLTKTMDFKQAKEIGKDINDEYLTTHSSNGYDHYFRFDKTDINEPQIVLSDSISKRKLTIYTTYPGVVMYSYNYPELGRIMMYDVPTNKNMGVALECQYAPDVCNNNFFDEGVLKVGEKYHEEICYKFEVMS